MSDNVGYTPGVGALVASRNVTYSGDSAKMQVVGLATLTGADDAKVPTDVNSGNPLPIQAVGELIEAVEAMRIAIAALTKTIGFALPNALGQPIMEVRQGTAGQLQMTASLAGGQSLATLTNQQQIGGFASNDQIPALMHLQADNLRRNITVS
jgi:hypothetical protein